MENKTPEEILFDQIEIAKSKYPDENWMSSEEILASPEFSFVINALKEYGKQQYNQAVLDCIENAKVKRPEINSTNMIRCNVDKNDFEFFEVDAELIKKLLK